MRGPGAREYCADQQFYFKIIEISYYCNRNIAPFAKCKLQNRESGSQPAGCAFGVDLVRYCYTAIHCIRIHSQT